jgi:hypothetical protein
MRWLTLGVGGFWTALHALGLSGDVGIIVANIFFAATFVIIAVRDTKVSVTFVNKTDRDMGLIHEVPND